MTTPAASVQWAQYLAARTLDSLLGALPMPLNLSAAASLGRTLHAWDARHRERARAHIQMAMPELPPAQRQDIVRGSFEHIVQLAVEVLMSPRQLTHGAWSQRLELNNLHDAIRMLSAGRPALLVTGHLGNWEILGSLLALLGYPLHALARPLDNPLINDWLTGIRERRGLKVITKWKATDVMLDVVRQGGALGFIADQNAGDKGLFVPFFGCLASTYKSIGLLAISENLPVICGYAHRLPGDWRYELGIDDIILPEDWSGREDPLYYVTARYMRSIENMVRRRPEQYLWTHRRWKSRPRFERLDRPMPDALRRSIEALPWITPSDLDRLARKPTIPL